MEKCRRNSAKYDYRRRGRQQSARPITSRHPARLRGLHPTRSHPYPVAFFVQSPEAKPTNRNSLGFALRGGPQQKTRRSGLVVRPGVCAKTVPKAQDAVCGSRLRIPAMPASCHGSVLQPVSVSALQHREPRGCLRVAVLMLARAGHGSGGWSCQTPARVRSRRRSATSSAILMSRSAMHSACVGRR